MAQTSMRALAGPSGRCARLSFMALSVVCLLSTLFARAASEEGTSKRPSETPSDGGSCTNSPMILFPSTFEKTQYADSAKSATPPRVHFAYGRGRTGQEKPMQVLLPAPQGTGYTLVLLDVYRGLDLPVDFLEEIRQKLGKKIPAEGAETKEGEAGEDTSDVLHLKVFPEPLKQHGVIVSNPEERLLSRFAAGKDSSYTAGNKRAFVSEITPEEAGDVAVAFALVRPWKMSDAPQIYIALAHFD